MKKRFVSAFLVMIILSSITTFAHDKDVPVIRSYQMDNALPLIVEEI